MSIFMTNSILKLFSMGERESEDFLDESYSFTQTMICFTEIIDITTSMFGRIGVTYRQFPIVMAPASYNYENYKKLLGYLDKNVINISFEVTTENGCVKNN